MSEELQKIMDRFRKEYPDCSISVKKVDENLYAVSIKDKDSELKKVVYVRGEK